MTSIVTEEKIIISIAIVEDEEKEFRRMEEMLTQYSAQTGETFSVSHFPDALSLLEGYTPKYDIVLMDIALPHMNGMDAAKKLREIDKTVALIFVTNMAQYAVNGYEVNAMDFIVKPVSYSNFSLKIKRALEYIHNDKAVKISIYTPDGVNVISASAVKYVEVSDHKIIWHTTDGELVSFGSLTKVENDLPKPEFIRCNACYIVNLKYVKEVHSNSVVMKGGEELQISRSKKQNFLRALADYL